MQEVINFCNYLKQFFHVYFEFVKLSTFLRKNYRRKQKFLIKNNFPFFFKGCKYNARCKILFFTIL